MKLIDVSKLNEATIIYDKTLRSLPFATMEEVAKTLKLNVMDIQGEHSMIHERRRAGGTQSYKIGKDFKKMEQLLGYEPSKIKPLDVVCITKENSKKYDDNELLIVGGQPVSNITKKHPLETRVVFSLVKSHAEDVVYSLFHGERDEDSDSPAGSIDGFYTKADMLIAAGAVNAARGNFATSGIFAKPTSDTDYTAYENLVEWIGGAHTFLRSSQGGTPQLLCAETVLIAAREALRKKLRMFDYPTMAIVLETLRQDAMCPTLEICSHEALGLGSRLILQKAGNLDLAANTKTAGRFCQIRDIYEDPNEWQFWLQTGYGTRIQDWHEKVFRTNEQKNDPLDLSGDYCNTGAIQVDVEGVENATWRVQGKSAVRNNGQCLIGLAPGTYTIVFDAVDGKTKPANKQVTVVAGETATESGTYA